MAYRCKNCNFRWDESEGNFQKVLDHEKTHLKEKTIHVAGKTV